MKEPLAPSVKSISRKKNSGVKDLKPLTPENN